MKVFVLFLPVTYYTLAHKATTKRKKIENKLRVFIFGGGKAKLEKIFTSTGGDGVFVRNSVSMKTSSLIVVVVVMAEFETLR